MSMRWGKMINEWMSLFTVKIQQSRNEELSLELMKQAKAKAALVRELRGQDMSLEAEEELDRIKAVVSRLSYVKVGVTS